MISNIPRADDMILVACVSNTKTNQPSQDPIYVAKKRQTVLKHNVSMKKTVKKEGEGQQT